MHCGSSILTLKYAIRTLDDHDPSCCITSGLASIAASLVAPLILHECIANSFGTSREFATLLSPRRLSHNQKPLVRALGCWVSSPYLVPPVAPVYH